MRTNRIVAMALAASLGWMGMASAAAQDIKKPDPGADNSPRIQVALLLDTSNSMDGLIEQAKGKLWSIVNEFARYRKGDVPPQLEIALFEYGNDGLSRYNDYIRQVAAFTTDLD